MIWADIKKAIVTNTEDNDNRDRTIWLAMSMFDEGNDFKMTTLSRVAGNNVCVCCEWFEDKVNEKA